MKYISFAKDAVNYSIEFISKLQNENNYNFSPVRKGMTQEGKTLKLGFSTYGLKLYYMLGEWNKLSEKSKLEWAKYINSFQKNEKHLPKNSYIDPVIFDHYNNFDLNQSSKDIVKKMINISSKFQFDTNKDKFYKAINAETKQAISSLHQVGFKNAREYKTEFSNSEQILDYLYSLDWKKPWTSGAQFASLCVYSSIDSYNNSDDLIKFINKIVDKETGSYFLGQPSQSREVINGAMKVLSGLDWINHEIHYPEKLIDYCLSNTPVMEGCDIVDFIYVLYRCTQQTNYKKKEVLNKLNNSIPDIKELYHKNENGFSYYKNKSQTHYYGVKISTGLNTPDIHGTLLCIWGILMILDANDKLESNFKIIKP